MPKLHSRLAVIADEGLSLIEIIVAMAIVAVIATASAGLVVNGIKAAASQERRQVAVTIASGLVEAASANGADLDPTTNVTQAVQGRTAAAVTAAWAANTGRPGVSTTTPLSDTLATTRTGGERNKISPPDTNLSGTTYSSTVLIGGCYQSKSGGDCVAVASPASSMTQLIRVIVIVKWTPGTNCGSTGCSYQTTTLLDPHADLEWVTNG